MKTIAKILLVLVLVSVPIIPPISTVQSYDIRSTCPEADSNDYFFPIGLYESKNWKERDDFKRKWYSSHLRVMAEPSLSCGFPEDRETYRFVWLRTFHAPIAVRVSKSKNDVQLQAIELNGAGGYSPGVISRRVAKKLSDAEWNSITKLLVAIQFWKLPTEVPSNGLDGAQWIFEGRQDGKYHIVDRWTPRDGTYHDLGVLFLQLSGLSIPEKEIY
jgi:hypothetical protein